MRWAENYPLFIIGASAFATALVARTRMRPSTICSFVAAGSRVARHERRVLSRNRFEISASVKPIA
jgi:hypothetical protein